MKSPAFQLYAGDFFVDTITWDLDELGLYTRLLFIEWTNGPLPSDPKRLAKIAGTSLKKFNYLFEMVSPKFIQNGEGFLINERLEETRQAQKQFIENQREKGKKRASERWAGHIATATKRLQPEGKPEHSSSSSTSSSTSKDKKTLSVYTDDFLSFWEVYPKKTGSKKIAFENWKRLNGNRPETGVILSAIKSQIKWRGDAGVDEFRPEWKDPERWIKGRMWEIELKSNIKEPRRQYVTI